MLEGDNSLANSIAAGVAMRASPLSFMSLPVAFAVARYFQPPAVLAVILILTLMAALRRLEHLQSRRQLWIIVTALCSGLTVTLAFLGALLWMTRIGIL